MEIFIYSKAEKDQPSKHGDQLRFPSRHFQHRTLKQKQLRRSDPLIPHRRLRQAPPPQHHLRPRSRPQDPIQSPEAFPDN